MLDSLGEKLQQVFKKVRGFGKLSESNIADAMREVRLALLSADVNYQVARSFCERVKEKALGQEVQGSIRPGDLFVKIVHDELVSLFGEGGGLSTARPLRLMVCGLNGAGKTTTVAKLGVFLRKQKRRVGLVAADLSRPAAVDQLRTLARQVDLPVVVPEAGTTLERHLVAARAQAEREGWDGVLFDMAGRNDVDENLLVELKRAAELIDPQETLLVVDAATGQSAVEVARAFQASAPLTGIVLSKFDGDTRGGAALSLREVTGCPIKFLGTGEGLNGLEVFDARRLVSRLLGMGDIVGLVEVAQEQMDLEDAACLQEKMARGQLNLEDFLHQMRQLKKLGPLQNLLGMIPGMNKLPSSVLNDSALKRAEAIICSMTPGERRRPEILNARRRQRIALGSGTRVADVNDLLRRFQAMKKMMSKLARSGNQERQLKRLLGQRLRG